MSSKPTPKKAAPKAAPKSKKSKADAKAIPTRQTGRKPATPRHAADLAAAEVARMAQKAQEDKAREAAGGGDSAPAQVDAGGTGTGGGVSPEDYAAVRDGIIRDFGLSDREARFVMELVVDENASAAYVRAGYSEKNADSNAARLSGKDSIRAAAAHVRAKIAERAGYKAEEALRLAADILRADARELVAFHRSCCRFCYGDRFLYQRTEGEMRQDRARHEAMVARRQERNKDYVDPGFDEQGGAGFDMRKPPNTECPACAGEGVGRVVVQDTRKLSREAAALYAGAKEGKEGIEVKMHDKMAALDKMFRYHGLYEVDNKQKAAQAVDPAALIALSEEMDRARAERLAIMERRKQMGFTGD